VFSRVVEGDQSRVAASSEEGTTKATARNTRVEPLAVTQLCEHRSALTC